MGRYFSGIIPITTSKKMIDERYVKINILDFYDEVDESKYVIKPDILLNNFKDFYIKFNEIIDEEDLKGFDPFNQKYDEIVKNKDLDKFKEYFGDPYDKKTKNYHDFDNYLMPKYRDSGWCFDTLGINPIDFLHVYHGSYKADFEVYSTFYHMNQILRKAIDNPLAQVFEFGLFG
ncbi:MAG: hypothetical protein LBJ93_00645 [Clostridiales bacterium]|jgi:hypothetical protein|nr:hypothetical protein [Clostridiales bacterium]